MAGDFRELSGMRWNRAIESWHKCLESGVDRDSWPGPTEGIGLVTAPGWMLANEITEEAMIDG